MPQSGRIEIPCNDSTGRPRALTLSLLDGAVCLTTPPPAACLSWHQVDQLQRALAEVRTRMPGAPA